TLLFMSVARGFCLRVLHAFGMCRSSRLSPTSREWRDLAAAVLVATIPIWATADVLHLAFMTTSFLPVFVPLAFCGLGVERRGIRVLARSIRRHGRELRNVIILGSGDEVFDMASRLARRVDLGYHIAEMLDVGERGDAVDADLIQRLRTLLES